MSLTQAWGLTPPTNVTYAWGARAIYQNGTIDLLWDRQSMSGTCSEEERKELAAWLDDKALLYLRSLCRYGNGPDGSSAEVVEVRGDGFTLLASPRKSYGYLYLGAWPDDSSTEGTPLPLIPNKAKTKCRRCGAYPGSAHKDDCAALPTLRARQK